MPHPAVDRLPPPDAAAAAHSARVAAAIRRAIDAAGGFLSFAEYMQLALYAPGLGYYVAGARKFGPDGDFVTAPEMTVLFGAALATQVEAILAVSPRRDVLELGAGSGRLAADLLLALAARDALPRRYAILEVSAELRERQRRTIARDAAAFVDRVEWCDAVPRIEGAVLMNEVLDAVPAHVVARRGGAWLELGVVAQGDTLGWGEQPLRDAALQARAQARFPAGIDYASEINPAAEALVQSLASRLAAGAILVIDYGYPRHERYHPERDRGTLMGHYRHRVHADPFLWPGLCDLTAHVDFTAVADAGNEAGLAVAGYTSQAAFLLGCGILDRLREFDAPGTLRYVEASAAVQRLVSPSEMGELVKVIALARTPGIDWPGFALADARHRL